MMKFKSLASLALGFSSLCSLYGQDTQKYWIEIDASKFTLSSDFQLDTLVIESKSLWLNAFTSELTPSQVNNISKNQLVKAVSPVQTLRYSSDNAQNGKYGDYIVSLNPEYFEKLGIDGKGVIAGVIDAGFVKVNTDSAFAHLIKDNRILGYRDFILDEKRKDFFDKQTSGDFHGANVLAYFGGYDIKNQARIGLATGASFYLARTENGDKEHLVEEDDWIEAIEWMHNKGVRVVNTSLGYSEFDDTTQNHTVQDMNGKTTKISIAAQKAVDLGMILVCSAGNLGLKPWKYVSAPADAEGVISVGATYKNDFAKEGYSSVGPEFNPYLKPDISTYSDRGTSYSSPEMAGLVACVLQKYPTLTPQQMKDALSFSGHMNPLPNNYVGYGVPDPVILFDYLAGKTTEQKKVTYLKETDDKIVFRINEKLQNGVVVYHKSDKVHVTDQLRISHNKKDSEIVREMISKKVIVAKYSSKIKRKKSIITIYRPSNAVFSTVVINGKLTEIEWTK